MEDWLSSGGILVAIRPPLPQIRIILDRPVNSGHLTRRKSIYYGVT